MENSTNNLMAIKDNNEVLGKKKRKYDIEFKNQVIAVYKSGIYESVSACAVAYDLSVNTLHTWLHKYRKESTPEALATQISELSQLKKELARAKMENEILKKAAIYFATQAQ